MRVRVLHMCADRTFWVRWTRIPWFKVHDWSSRIEVWGESQKWKNQGWKFWDTHNTKIIMGCDTIGNSRGSSWVILSDPEWIWVVLFHVKHTDLIHQLVERLKYTRILFPSAKCRAQNTSYFCPSFFCTSKYQMMRDFSSLNNTTRAPPVEGS